MMIDSIVNFAMDPKVLAGTMFLLGLAQFDILKDIPVVGGAFDWDMWMGITPMKVLGAIALVDGFMLLRAMD
tara:strand:- start:658 stop:873 length:216 start_codon:yes stop_codon:yes gene_type:complete